MLDLTGKKALVTGIANERSIAWGIAQQLHKAGATLGVTYLPDERDRFKTKVQQLTEPLQPDFLLPCDVQSDQQIDELFQAIAQKWGQVDILVHCLAFVKKEELSGNFSDISREGFALAMDVSTYSLIALCRAAKPLLRSGSSILTLTYLGGGAGGAQLQHGRCHQSGPGNLRSLPGGRAGPRRDPGECHLRWTHSHLGFFGHC